MGFGDAIDACCKKMLRDTNTKIVEVSSELFTEVVKRTPIGTSDTKGQLINNWHVAQGINSINTTYTSSFNVSGINSYNQIATLRPSNEFHGKDGEVSFTNSVHYGFRAEYAGWPVPDWTGKVGPYAMVRNSLTFVAAKYK